MNYLIDRLICPDCHSQIHNEQIILYGDNYYPAVTGWLVNLIIKSSDVLLDKELPLIRWLGARQHVLAQKLS